MNNKQKKMYLLLLMVMCAASVAAYDIEIDGIYYLVNETNRTVSVTESSIGSEAYSGSVTIPETVVYNGVTYSVASIDKYAFYGCEITNLTIPNTVTSIGEGAFMFCGKLLNVNIPYGITIINKSVFHCCSSLNNISIPSSVTTIGEDAFLGCYKLTSITIPKSVTSITSNPFTSCHNLNSITVEGENSVYDSRNNSNAIIESSTNTLITGCKTTIIPNTVIIIANEAFSGNIQLTSISLTIPSSVVTIGEDAFSGCSGLKNVTIPNSVTTIGERAFVFCTGLTSVTIPNSITTINSGVFAECRKLENIIIPKSVTSIVHNPFMDCPELNSVIVDNENAVYDSRNNCNAIIESATNTLITGCKNTIIPNSVTSIGTQAFDGCTNLTNLTIPNSVTSIGSLAFYGTSLSSIICLPIDPPLASSTSFGYTFNNPSIYSQAELSVPDFSIDQYKTAVCWKEFSNITGVPILVSELNLDSDNNDIYINDTLKITATVLPEYASNKTLNWTSSNPSIAKVNSEGVVIGKSAGTAIITATTKDGSNLSASCTITVKKRFATSISINKSSTTINVGESEQLIATVYPTNASNKTVTWTSSNPSIATVSSSGLVTAVSAGNATITAKTADGSNLSATCSVTVNQLATSISISQTSATLYMGNSLQLSATVLPNNTTDKSVSWSSSNDNVATVSPEGLVTPISTGSATITVKTEDGSNLTAQCVVTVKQLATSISLSETDVTLWTGNTLQLTTTVLPSTTSNKSVTWTSSNPSVATVSSSGLVTAVSVGNATITVKTADGSNLSASCSVAVKQLATSISLNHTSATLYMGNSLQLSATVLPNNTTDKTVSWSSSNTDVAIVSSGGLVIPVSTGTAIITVKTEDGSNLTAQCVVTVKQLATSISLSETDVTIYTGNTLQLTATVLPSTTSNPTVTWSSSNTSVATVSSTGLVTAKSTGNAVITARTTDGTNISATCNMTVKRLATSILLNKTSATLYLNQTLQLTATVSPSNATDKSVVWTSSDNSVATVSTTGLVTAIATGNATITATTADGSNLSATCEITVNAYVTSLTLDQSEVTILEGDTITLTPTILPSYATNQNIYWSSNNTSVATVSNGVVVGRSGGETTISARTADGTNLYAYCQVKIIPNFDISMPNFSHIRGSANNKFDLTIDLANRYDITGMQFDLLLPDGVTIAKDNNGEYDIWPDDIRKSRNHTATASLLGNSTYRILLSSATANILKGHSGTVLHIMIEVPLYHVSGNKQIRYTNIILSEPDETRHTVPTKTSMISYYYKEGDANADVSVDVADYVITGNYILQYSTENFWYDAANVDYNSTIDVNDLTGITNIALGRREGGILQMPAIQQVTEEDIKLTAEPLDIQKGQTKSLDICLNESFAFAGFQMDMQLPEGLKFVDASLIDEDSGLSLATAELTDGSIRLLASSFSLKDLSVSNSSFLRITLTAEDEIEANGEIKLTDIKFSKRNMTLLALDDYEIPVGNGVSGLQQVYSSIRIYPEGNSIIIDSPKSGTARIVTVAGISLIHDIQPGHNVIPMDNAGLYIVTLNGTTAKLYLK